MPQRLPNGSLVALLRRAATGDECAHDELLTYLRAAALPYARKQVRSRADAGDLADDVVQEALLRMSGNLWRCRATVDAEVVSWAVRITYRVLVDNHRKRAREMIRRLSPELETLLYASTESTWQPCERSRPESVLDRLVRSTISSLPPDLQRLLELRVFQGAKWEEIGEELGTTASGAKRRFQRAQAALQRELLERAEKLPHAKRIVARRCLSRLGIRT